MTKKEVLDALSSFEDDATVVITLGRAQIEDCKGLEFCTLEAIEVSDGWRPSNVAAITAGNVLTGTELYVSEDI